MTRQLARLLQVLGVKIQTLLDVSHALDGDRHLSGELFEAQFDVGQIRRPQGLADLGRSVFRLAELGFQIRMASLHLSQLLLDVRDVLLHPGELVRQDAADYTQQATHAAPDRQDTQTFHDGSRFKD